MNDLNPQDFGIDTQLRYYFNTLVSFQGGVALFVFLALLVCTARFDRLKWFVLSLMLYTATLGFSNNPLLDNTLAFPLQQIRALYRPLPLGLLFILVLPALGASRGARWKPLGAGVIAFFVFELGFSGRYIFANLADLRSRGVFGLTVFVGIFITLGVGVSKWLQSLDDVHALLRSVVGSGAVLVVATLYQVVINRAAVLDGGRLLGTTNNPQHLGIYLALCLPVSAYLFTRRGESPGWRGFHAAFMGLGLLFLLWSGSRSGMLVLVVGMALLFRARLGRLALVGAVVGGVVLVAVQFLDTSLSNAGRFTSTLDTRTVIWTRLWRAFLANPVLGNPAPENQGESSYLSAAASFGLVGLFPLVVAAALFFRDVARMQRLRGRLGEQAFLVDLVTATLVTMLMVGFFELYLIGTVTEYVFCIYLFGAVTAFLIDPAWYAYPAPEPVPAGGEWGLVEQPGWPPDGVEFDGYLDGGGNYDGAPAPFGRQG